jgi:hypothetical protein
MTTTASPPKYQHRGCTDNQAPGEGSMHDEQNRGGAARTERDPAQQPGPGPFDEGPLHLADLAAYASTRTNVARESKLAPISPLGFEHPLSMNVNIGIPRRTRRPIVCLPSDHPIDDPPLGASTAPGDGRAETAPALLSQP